MTVHFFDKSSPEISNLQEEVFVLPVSFAQQRMWFLDQLESGNPFYNHSTAVRLAGQLNVAALEQSFNEIVRRHEILRTTFSKIEGEAVQVIRPTFRITLPVIDLRSLSQTEQEVEIQRLATESDRRCFDLTQLPLLRLTLLQLGDKEYVLLLTMHHIIADGWSQGVIVREMAALYEVFCNGEPSPLPDLPVQYADFAVWQRDWMQGKVLETQLDYWKQELTGAPPLLEFPADKPRPPIQSFQGSKEYFAFSKELSEALKTLSFQNNVTLFMTLLAAFKTLLYRYAGQDDILVGSPIAKRNRAELEKLIGIFVNTLVLRTNLSGDPTFLQLLERVRQVALGAYAHQDLPFEKLVEELQPERNLSYTPLFQVMFVLHNAPMPPLELPGLTLNLLEIASMMTPFDLSFHILETSTKITGWVEYSTDLFEKDTIVRFIGHFKTLVKEIIINPEGRISQFSLLTAAKRHQIIKEWNQTQSAARPEGCIHQLFEAQVKRTPDAVAAVFEDQKLTYRELNQRANQLAHYLEQLGVGQEVVVGIYMERSLEMLIGVLGILKAGGAYVPLDPNYPSDRLAFMLADARVPVILTQMRLVESLPKSEARLLCLDAESDAIASESRENPAIAVTPDNRAYVIYTSGSTGKPKGVQILHRAVVNFLSSMSIKPGLTDRDVLLSVTTLSFDIAALELYLPLIVGAKVAIASREVAADGLRLSELLRESGATVMQATPATWRLLLAAGWAGSKQLKILVGGEALSRELAERLRDRGSQLWNLYGPTETTIWSTVGQVESGESSVPIGRPIANTQIYILDEHLMPVPIGVFGELHIGGVGLSYGYLNRPDLTAEKFIPNPYSDRSGTRLYKTGDLARYLPNGEIEYLRRIDNQVKLRGFRIELGEIEETLRKHPAVQEAAAIVREDELGNKRLVAYVVQNPDSPGVGESGAEREWHAECLSNSRSILEETYQLARELVPQLRDYLHEKLPEYMIPSAFVTLEALPLTPNGKVDRRALPAPERSRLELEETFVAPRTPVEEILAEIWAQMLGVEQIGIQDNFFELGGDSIVSIQVIAQANQAGLRLTPKQLFQYQTIAQLAAVATPIQTARSQQNPVTGSVPLTPIQHWFFEQNLAEPHHWNQAIFLEMGQPIDSLLLEQVVRELLKHHDALRLRFVSEESGWQQINASPDKVVPFIRIDLSSLPSEEQETAVEAAAAQLQASFNLAEGPLVRVALFDFGGQTPNHLLFVIHHLVIDGVSWRILLEDFQTACEQINRGQAIAFPPKTTSFKEWSERLQKYARSSELQEQLDYWLSECGKQVSRLPIDYPNGVNTVATASTVSVTLSAEETRSLLQEVPAAYRTQMNDALLTALAQALEPWTKSRSLLIDLEGHGREDIFEDVDLSRTVGWFTTVSPVLLNLEKATQAVEALKIVKEQLRGIPHRGIGYGVLRYLNGESADKMRSLLQAEVSFNYLGQLDINLPDSSLFTLIRENIGAIRSPQGSRRYLIEINGFIAGGQLKLEWTYSESVHRRETVRSWAERFVEKLRLLIAYCQSPEAGGYTPSDLAEFQWSQWSQEDLDNITTVLGEV